MKWPLSVTEMLTALLVAAALAVRSRQLHDPDTLIHEDEINRENKMIDEQLSPHIRHAQDRLRALGVDLPATEIHNFADVDAALAEMEAVVKSNGRFEQLTGDETEEAEEADGEAPLDDEAKDAEAALKAKLDIPPMPKPKTKNQLIATEILETMDKVVTQMTGWNNPLGMKHDERDAVQQVMKNAVANKLGGDEMVQLLKPS